MVIDRQVVVGALLPGGLAVPEGVRGDRERPGDDAQRLDDAEDSGRGDRADADEADVAAEDLVGVHLGDRPGSPDRSASGKLRPIIQISGTSTKFDSAPPAHRIIEERSPMT